MDQVIQQAQDRLIKRRAELKATEPPIQWMQSVDRCEHGILISIGCCICNPHETDNVENCEHGREKDGYCPECYAKKEHEDYVEQEKKKYREELSDLRPCLKKSGVPSKYLGHSFDSFIGNDKAIRECRSYQNGGLVLFGATGCGKTHLAVSVMRERLKNNISSLIEREWRPGYTYMPEQSQFITIPDLLLEIRSSFGDDSGRTEEQVIDHYSTIPFLVLDDMGSEKTTEFSITTLYIIIDRRDRDLLPTVITTNLSSQETEERLDARIASRLAGWKNIRINMPDYRKKR